MFASYWSVFSPFLSGVLIAFRHFRCFSDSGGSLSPTFSNSHVPMHVYSTSSSLSNSISKTSIYQNASLFLLFPATTCEQSYRVDLDLPCVGHHCRGK